MIIHLTTKQEIWLNEHQEKTDCFGTPTGFAPAIAYRGIVSSINSRFANPAILLALARDFLFPIESRSFKCF
jgi:hypothetical protein